MTKDESIVATPSEPALLAALSVRQQAQLSELLDRYLYALEHANSIDVDSMLEGHPELTDAFHAYISQLDLLHGLAHELPTAGTEGTAESSGLAAGVAMHLGDFRIIREIGRGGMGIVYEAHQNSLDRRVALKLLPIAAMLDSRQIARFKNESRAAGQLRHPNVVPVFSVGAERRIHFYAMQLIDGPSVDAWIQRHGENGESNQTSSRDNHWRSVVGYAVEIADALHCAHESGVVHRDVKPSNLLLDHDGKIWITDFGLATCQSELSITISGDVLGTMRYMSPEQAAGRSEQVDHRTDVYSLAATVFEMLTLQPAISGEDGPAILRSIESAPPPRLLDFIDGIPSDLTVVLQKAMAKRKDDRYESSRAFASDLQAVLDDRPIGAKPLSAAIRVARWTSRHHRSVAAVSSVLAVGLVWLVVSVLMILQESQAAHDSKIQRDIHFNQAFSTVDELSSLSLKLASVPGTEQIRKSLLQETLDYYRQFVAQAADDPRLDQQIAVTHTRIGNLISELEGSANAVEHYQTAAELYEKLSEPIHQSNSLRQHVAHNWNQLGLALAKTNRASGSQQAYGKAISIQRALATQNPNHADYLTEWATSINNLGLLQREMGRIEKSRVSFKRSIELLTPVASNDPTDGLASRSLAAALANLSSLSLNSNPQVAGELLEQAIRQRLDAVAHSPDRLRSSAEIASLYNNLGSAKLRSKAFAAAEQAFGSAIRLQRQLRNVAPLVDGYCRDLALSLNNLAMVQQHQQDQISAVKTLREAIELQNGRLDAGIRGANELSQLGVMEHNLAVSLTALQQDVPAEESLRSAIALQKSSLQLSPQLDGPRSHLSRHFQSLLKSQARREQWNAARSTANEYRKLTSPDTKSRAIVDRTISRIMSERRRQVASADGATSVASP